MGRQPAKQPDPPEWFDLAKYQAARKLTARQWLDQLVLRRLNQTHPTWQRIEMCRRHGIAPVSPDPGPPSEVDPVRPMRAIEWYRIGRGIDENLVAEMTAFHEQVYLPILYQGAPLDDFQWSSEQNGASPVNEIAQPDPASIMADTRHLSVDLSHSDKELTDSFKQWLKNERKKSKLTMIKKGLTKYELSRWADAQVLAYLDLVQWAEDERLHPTQFQLGEWLFPDSQTDPAERIRQTVEPLARSLMDAHIIAALFFQIERDEK
ncbi:MAG: DUF6387 family protein [Gammaproteobacteria bacterium SHHR-1]